jgi:hypothetical protein
MFKVTRYCVLPYDRRGGVLVKGEVQQFYARGDAEAVAERYARRKERVDLYEVTGWPVQDIWDRPRLLVRKGHHETNANNAGAHFPE